MTLSEILQRSHSGTSRTRCRQLIRMRPTSPRETSRKRHDKRLVHFLTRPEIEALLAAPDRTTWIGRRDYALLLLAVQTGLRLSELTGLDRDAVVVGRDAHVRCFGKGRKERCTPLTKHPVHLMQAWLKEPSRNSSQALFPNLNQLLAFLNTL